MILKKEGGVKGGVRGVKEVRIKVRGRVGRAMDRGGLRGWGMV